MDVTTDTRGNVVKMEQDCSKSVDKALAAAKEAVEAGDTNAGLVALYSAEKEARLAADAKSSSRVLVAIIQLCFQQKNWALLNENLVLLARKRSQLKQSVTSMIQEACTYVDHIQDESVKLKFIDTLGEVTAGKIYVEVERARLLRKLAAMKEEKGDVSEAATILQEIQVETFGNMEKREKLDFILEQMRLCLAKGDYVRAQVISKKISTKVFDGDQEQDLKLRYYLMMVQLHTKDELYLMVAKHYQKLASTPLAKLCKASSQLVTQWEEWFNCMILFMLLAPYDSERVETMNTVALNNKELADMPVCKELVDMFQCRRMISWLDFEKDYAHKLRSDEDLFPTTRVFSRNTDEGARNWEVLRKRVVEHNIQVIAECYTRITMNRLSEILHLSEQDAESFLCALVTKQTVFARIDRPQRVVTFRPQLDSGDVMNKWSRDLQHLMKLVHRATHLIHKEININGPKPDMVTA